MLRFLRFPNNSVSKPTKNESRRRLFRRFLRPFRFFVFTKTSKPNIVSFPVRRFRLAFSFDVPVRRFRSEFPFGVFGTVLLSVVFRNFNSYSLLNRKILPCRYTKNAHLCKRSTLRDVRYFCLSQNRFVQQTCANFLPRMSIQFLKIAKRQSIKPKSKNFSVLPPFAAAFSSALRRKACV